MRPSLVDHHQRTVDYLRVSITDLCNLRCVYCRPPEGVKLVSHNDILRYEEILAIIRAAKDLGIRKIRITGGEPLVRRGAVEFIRQLVSLKGIEDVGLTTNGVLLSSMAQELVDAGLKRINVSLDSLRTDTFKHITGRDYLAEVVSGIDEAIKVGLTPVKINMVLLDGINEQDVPDFARLTLDKPLDVRFIERMPFGSQTLPNSPDSFSARKAMEIISKKVGKLDPVDREPLDGPATMFRLAGASGRIGIIDPVTGHFCGTCNRLRLTARGTLRPCLLSPQEIDVKSALRRGASQEALARIFRAAVLAKPVGGVCRHTAMNDNMNAIGG
ncbi:MAG: GTP 3',8-cyclase MoaA [Desulfomonile sp.]|nr:GTP 3',8-cyclase MoaA [Deltaproteobacteria bacterium]